MVIDKPECGEGLTSIALPLRHEDETVGALLLRLTNEFDEEDRSLLAAVGGQMARNLQREESHNLTRTSSPVSIFSTRGSNQKLQSLYVLNGALLEQRVGLNALAEVGDGVALAYLDGRLAHTNSTLLAIARLVPDEVLNLTFF